MAVEEYTKSRDLNGKVVLLRTDTVEVDKEVVLESLNNRIDNTQNDINRLQANLVELQAKKTAVEGVR